jgi:hypothetical protein
MWWLLLLLLPEALLLVWALGRDFHDRKDENQ